VASQPYDVAVIGAGIVGLAVARALEAAHPSISIVVLEKEDRPGTHQTGHNSGVVHSGLYYRPGSLKARLCVDGRRRLLEFCREEDISVSQSGKIVVATSPAEVPLLRDLYERGTANGLSGLELLGPSGIRDIEPHATGEAGLWVPESAVTDFSVVAARLASRLGGDVVTGAGVDRIVSSPGAVRLGAGDREFTARRVINCAGLHADRVARLAGHDTGVRIIPFRGEYYELVPQARDLVRGLIYPVPDPQFPFLGVHFTRKLDGSVEVGPNAVLALAREHYRGERPVFGDLWETVRFRGFWHLVRSHWRSGAEEMWHSLRPSSYAKQAQSLVPELSPTDLIRAGAGVRAQAVSPEGALLDDFEIVEADRFVHVLNAPSPAATSSLAIGEHIASLVDPGER
jgi:L-2-hydroxyglutarate oxidase LhgO